MKKKLKKVSQCRKKLKGGGRFEIFNIHSVAKFRKKIEGELFGGKIPNKSLAMPKITERGTLWSQPVLYVTRETFLVHFLRPTDTIWGHLEIL